MTSSSPSSVRNAAFRFAPCALCLALCALGTGCGPKDGQKEYAEATQAYSLRNFDKAAALFAKAAELNAANVDALVMLTRTKLDLGELDGAKDAIARAAALAPNDRDVVELSAQVAWHAKDYDRARELYLAIADNAAEDASARAQAYVGLGVIDIALADNGSEWLRDRARTEFLRAIALDPKSAAAHYHLGLLYKGMNYYNAAIDRYKYFVYYATEADPRLQDVQRNVLPALADASAAAVAQTPGAANRDSAAAAAAIKKAEDAERKGLFKTARQRYEEALKADPLSYPAAVGLAKAWAKTDKTDLGRRKAYEAYAAACRLRSTEIKTFLATGELAMSLKLYASAVEIYSRAIAARPQDISAIDGLIRALRQCKRFKAADVYQRYRETIPVKKRS